MSSKLPGVMLAFLLLAGVLCESHAFVQSTNDAGGKLHWPASQATLNLRVGCPPNSRLSAWGPCWDDAAEDAAAQWNAVGADFRFRVRSPSRQAAVACTSSAVDGIATVIWADMDCGMAFGDDTLAVTNTWSTRTGELGDSDVLFNTAYSWSTYAGPQRPGVVDFHRVAIHEFGHVLGLSHPDEHGQRVTAIMNSKSDNNDRLRADDIAGIKAIYGRTAGTTTKGVLENPGHRSFKSGIGVISGWVCHANRVEVVIGRSRLRAAYGTERPDTRSVCGDTNNGFAILINWNIFGDGVHTAQLLVDGVALGGQAEFKVTTFGEEFLRGAEGVYGLRDFPLQGTTAVIVWDQNSQNFVIRGVE